MSYTRNKNVIVGAAMLAAGLAYIYLVAGLPRRGAVDATFLPYILASAMILLGLLQMAVAWFGSSPAAAQTVDDEGAAKSGARPSYGTVLMTLALVAGFIALLRPLGFPFAAMLYLFFQFIVLTPADRKPSYGHYAILAFVCSVVIFVAFRYGFDLILPAGPLLNYLP